MVRFVKKQIDDTAERESEDIVQDVMLSIFDKSDFTIPIENLTAYIYRALRNRVIDIFRKRKLPMVSIDSNQTSESEDYYATSIESVADERVNVSKEWERNEMKKRVHVALHSLEKGDRELLLETEFRGKTCKEVAESRGVPLGTILSQKFRVLKKLEILLKDSHYEL